MAKVWLEESAHMELSVHDVKKWVGREESFAVAAETLPDLEARLEAPLRGPIKAAGRVRNAGSLLLVELEGSVLLQMACARCGSLADIPVTFSDMAQFREERPGPEDDWFAYENETLRLDDWVSDEILLSVPIAPLCRTDCRGLCPQCGADWNESACACAPPPDDRWGALAGFRAHGDDAD
jgi:uncharacterized protein